MAKLSDYLIPALAIGTSAAIFWAITRPGGGAALPPPPPDPTQDPQALATGWLVNDLCTQADMVQPAIAHQKAEQWRSALNIPAVPIPDFNEAGEMPQSFVDALWQQLDAFFAAHFPGCDKAPDALFGGDRVASPSELAVDVAMKLESGQPVTDPLESFVLHTAGLGGFQ